MEMDSDEELPCINFSCNNMRSQQNRIEDAEMSRDVDSGTADTKLSQFRACAHSTAVIISDSDSNDDDPLSEGAFSYNKNLRERCEAVVSAAAVCINNSDLLLDVHSAKTSLADDQQYCSSASDTSSAVWKSCENSEEVASVEFCCTSTASDISSQTSSIQSNNSERRKRPLKADDPEAVVHYP